MSKEGQFRSRLIVFVYQYKCFNQRQMEKVSSQRLLPRKLLKILKNFYFDFMVKLNFKFKYCGQSFF